MRREYDLYVVYGKCGSPKTKIQCENELLTAKQQYTPGSCKCSCKMDWATGEPHCTCTQPDNLSFCKCKCPDPCPPDPCPPDPCPPDPCEDTLSYSCECEEQDNSGWSQEVTWHQQVAQTPVYKASSKYGTQEISIEIEEAEDDIRTDIVI